MITACAKPGPFRLPKRLARARRAAESRRMESFKDIQESLKATMAKEKALIEEWTEKLRELWDEDDNNVDQL